MVGVRGFEPPASASRTQRSSQTEPHPDSCLYNTSNIISQGGVFVNDEKVPSAQFAIAEDMLKEGVKIRKGKKVFHKAILA